MAPSKVPLWSKVLGFAWQSTLWGRAGKRLGSNAFRPHPTTHPPTTTPIPPPREEKGRNLPGTAVNGCLPGLGCTHNCTYASARPHILFRLVPWAVVLFARCAPTVNFTLSSEIAHFFFSALTIHYREEPSGSVLTTGREGVGVLLYLIASYPKLKGNHS